MVPAHAGLEHGHALSQPWVYHHTPRGTTAGLRHHPRPFLVRTTVDFFCNRRATSTCSPVRLVLFDVDGTLVDCDGAVATANAFSCELR